ncbi:conserved hypothetical protein [Acaryochloris marina MBIC11017]|uniref:Uncharacterized protein n=1 Tax=Acaryochloris marina (strain MBIC 11017) TaxID=329726 RepID=B0CAP5_ACAM1|nr:conserved hypothetical protein [Acaryochloris marina MBIC11017]
MSVGECWIALSLAKDSSLVLSGRIGKHTDELAQDLIENTEGKTTCHHWQTDGWEGSSRQPPDEVIHHVSKVLTQRLKRTNGILRQQTGRWHQRQNKFGKVWQQHAVTLTLFYHFRQIKNRLFSVSIFLMSDVSFKKSRTNHWLC